MLRKTENSVLRNVSKKNNNYMSYAVAIGVNWGEIVSGKKFERTILHLIFGIN